MSLRPALAVIILGVAVGVLGGCAGSRPAPTPIVPPGSQGVRQEYARALDARLESIRTMRAGLDMVWHDPNFPEAERCRGSLSFERPDRVRLRGISAAFFTIFDLVANERDVWLDVPREEFTVFGRRADPAWESLPLSPRWLLAALLAHPCPEGECLQSAVIESSDAETTRLVGDFGDLDVDTQSGLPKRMRSPDAVLIEWNEWSERGGVAWPEQVRLTREDGREWTVTFGRVTLGRSIPPSRFVWKQEQTREILTPSDALRRWNGQNTPK